MEKVASKEDHQLNEKNWQSGHFAKHPQVRELLTQRAKTGS